MVDKVLKELSSELNKMYSKVGRPSIPPEQLLRALLLQMLYSVRSERLLIEEIDYNILFRWFVRLNLDDAVWDATVFTKNRDRLLEAEVAKDFLALVVEQARGQGWASDEHFTVDGSLLEAWASAKSFQSKNKKGSPPDDPGNPTATEPSLQPISASALFRPPRVLESMGIFTRAPQIHFCRCTLMSTCPPVMRTLLVQGFRPDLMMVTSCQQQVSSISAGVAPT
jgi:transposase